MPKDCNTDLLKHLHGITEQIVLEFIVSVLVDMRNNYYMPMKKKENSPSIWLVF